MEGVRVTASIVQQLCARSGPAVAVQPESCAPAWGPELLRSVRASRRVCRAPVVSCHVMPSHTVSCRLASLSCRVASCRTYAPTVLAPSRRPRAPTIASLNNNDSSDNNNSAQRQILTDLDVRLAHPPSVPSPPSPHLALCDTPRRLVVNRHELTPAATTSPSVNASTATGIAQRTSRGA